MVGAIESAPKPRWRERRKANNLLDQARSELPVVRQDFIQLSRLILHNEMSEHPEKLRPLYCSLFFGLLDAQKEIVKEKVVKPKLTLGLRVFNRDIERKAKMEGGDYAESAGLPREFGIGVVAGHINITKKIQRTLLNERGIPPIKKVKTVVKKATKAA